MGSHSAPGSVPVWLLHARLEPAEHVVSATHAGATFLLDLGAHRHYRLDELGSRIWPLLEGGTTLAAIIERLRQEHHLPAETLEAQTVAALEELLSAALIRCVYDPEG